MFGAEFVMGLQQGKNEAQDEIEELKDERDKLQLGNLNLLDNNKKLRERVAELEGTCMAYWASRELDEEKIAKLEKENQRFKEALEDIATWSQELQDRMVEMGTTLAQWRGCIAIAKRALKGIND